ncbi:DNA/RNA helicase domain-containing protein [Kutzneria kofuensis]|uniref:AAA+ ATPase domain-containing protein n=1 Tax=Kutzneria kofuensis TaxID=103725 RepID=A0A7W9NIY6_9PSEU|nr:hypothetical protein [Kutzneria kofuensis]
MSDLLARFDHGQLIEHLQEQARYAGARAGAAEVRSWQNSLPVLFRDLVDAGLGDVEVLLEHQLPHSKMRIDVVLCGIHPRTRETSFVFVELKQWSRAEAKLESVVIVPALGMRIHPTEQVRGYCQYFIDHTPALAQRPRAVRGVAYLHNARRADVVANRVDEYGRLFTLDDRAKLVEHLRSVLAVDGSRDANRDAGDEFLRFEHRPTKPFLAHVAAELQDREQFVLLDDQKVAYEIVLDAVVRSRAAKTRTVVIVMGGPGSGKSVIALSLVAELARRGVEVAHATGSRSFTETMRKYGGKDSPRLRGMFKYFNSFVGAEPADLRVLICDEAHRIRETGVNRYTTKAQRERARRQIDELIDVATVPVFLLDENQVVRPGEMGSEAEITAAARAAGCEVEVIRLRDQLRCGGSVSYDTWVSRLLGIGPEVGPPIPWSAIAGPLDEAITVTSAPSPAHLEKWVLAQQAEYRGIGRLTAGFCWPWSKPTQTADGPRLVEDVTIGDWRRPWNAKADAKLKVPDVPESSYWATDERGFGQVGCIYTAQGFEYDWSGVIFGPDLVRRDGRWVSNRSVSKDPDLRRADDVHFTALVKNTYKVLLTRGMRGTAVFSTDPETQAFLEEMTS